MIEVFFRRRALLLLAAAVMAVVEKTRDPEHEWNVVVVHLIPAMYTERVNQGSLARALTEARMRPGHRDQER